MPDQVVMDAGGSVKTTDPYYYDDALKDGIVHEVLTPDTNLLWFKNREGGWNWPGGRREAYIIEASLSGNWHMATAIAALELVV